MATKVQLRAALPAWKSPRGRLARLTASAVDTLPPGRYTDPAAIGLQLQVRAKRDGVSRTWLLRYVWRGEWVRLTIGHRPAMSLADAREKVIRLRRGMDDGIDPRRAESRRRPLDAGVPAANGGGNAEHSIEHLSTEFLERYLKPHKKDPAYDAAILARDVLPEWRGRDARTIKPREVIDLLDKIVDRGSRVMANRTAALLGRMFKFGIHRSIVETTPVQLLMRPGGKEKPKQRALSDKELRAFLADPIEATRFRRLTHVLLILLLTAQRRGELAGASWREVDFDARIWRIPAEHYKNGREQIVPLTEWAFEEFQRLKKTAGRSPWVLPANDSSKPLDPKLLTRGLAKCGERFKKLGIGAFTLHDLRRTCRTGLARLKIEPHIAERVLGHAQGRIQATYDTHAYLDEKRAALEKWEAHLQRLRP